MRFGVLGSLEVRHGDALVDVGGRQQRLVLASLLATAGRPLSADALVDAIWGAAPPPSAFGTLQSYVSRLRKLVDPHGTGTKLVFDDAGYRLEAGADAVDFRRFEALADEGHGLLDRGQPDDAAAVLAEALALWRGPAFSELATHPFFAGIATRLEERRLTSVESRVEAELRLGRHAALVGELTELVSQHPLREGLRGQLALALYRSGRQADALAVLADARATLREELGVDPGPRLRALEAAILNHDAALEPAAPPATAPAGRVVTEGSGQPDATSSLAGRAVELDVLLQALREAATAARFVVIEGEPGIGKTHLAEELRARAAAAGSLAVWGRSDESGAAPSLWPWLPILRTLDEHSGTSGAEALDDLSTGDTPLLAGRGAAVRFERFEAIADQLERAGATAPVVALLDDLQWADATSLDLLRFLATRLRRGVLVVAIVRTLELGRSDDVTDTLGAIAGRPGSRRLQLAGLDEDATAALLDTAGFDADVSLVHRIHTRAEGNPFYALELARLLDESALTGTEVPATVRDVIRRRLGQLPESTRELLTVAAITGRDVDVHLLARAAALALDQCLDQLEPAVVHRYLVDSSERPGVLRFCHALVREVLADGLTPLRRARLHLSVADAIEASGGGADTAEIVADHLWRAAPIGVGRRAAEALERAAEVAVHRVSYAAAEDLLQRSVQLRRATATGDDDVRAELRVLLRWLEVMQATRYFQGADGGALARAQELAARFGDEDLHRKLYWYEWAALSTAASVDEAARLAERFLAQPAARAGPGRSHHCPRDAGDLVLAAGPLRRRGREPRGGHGSAEPDRPADGRPRHRTAGDPGELPTREPRAARGLGPGRGVRRVSAVGRERPWGRCVVDLRDRRQHRRVSRTLGAPRHVRGAGVHRGPVVAVRLLGWAAADAARDPGGTGGAGHGRTRVLPAGGAALRGHRRPNGPRELPVGDGAHGRAARGGHRGGEARRSGGAPRRRGTLVRVAGTHRRGGRRACCREP
jgi:DNA-binding SARP family transcriptional activator